ncbi:hypothetical protein [Coleofasciculus chthonoplastes]|uniref:hypothetical protein n=1 Tax=Coleofasciculus chthonoplastes TaxID=64178 RepID=UPI0012F853C0|nr:hypothetical protein [Coleofasciculus chthonoplastes]
MFLCLDRICYSPIFPQLDVRDRMADGEDSTTTNLCDRVYWVLMLQDSGCWVSYVNPTYGDG